MEEFDNNSRCPYPGMDLGMFKTAVCTSDGKKISGRTAIAFLQKDKEDPEENMLSGQEYVTLENLKLHWNLPGTCRWNSGKNCVPGSRTRS